MPAFSKVHKHGAAGHVLLGCLGIGQCPCGLGFNEKPGRRRGWGVPVFGSCSDKTLLKLSGFVGFWR